MKPLVRPALWLACCITAVGVHHTWFGIGKRSIALAFADGMVLVLLSVGMHRAHRKFMRPNRC